MYPSGPLTVGHLNMFTPSTSTSFLYFGTSKSTSAKFLLFKVFAILTMQLIGPSICG